MSSSGLDDDATKRYGISGGCGREQGAMMSGTSMTMGSGNGSGSHAGTSEVRGSDKSHGVSSSSMGDSVGGGSSGMTQQTSSSLTGNQSSSRKDATQGASGKKPT